MKLIAVQGATLQQNDPLIVCTIAPAGVPSIKCKAEGKGMLKDGFQVIVSVITCPSAGATIPDPAPYPAAFETTATKVKADGTLVLLEGDLTATISANPQIPGSPPVPYPVSFKIEIKQAGQTKCQGL
jgi:hypothetical protein